MPTIDPRILLALSVIFVGFAAFNLYLGVKRLREAHARGENLRWYKQLSILTGIEYVLLALSFVGSIGISNGLLPASLRPIVFPIYLLMLILAALLAGVVVYRNSKSRRVARTAATAAPSTATSLPLTARERTAEEQELSLQRRRERRQKAAAARRRRSGKA